MRFNPTEWVKPFQDVDPDVQTAGAKNGAGVDTRGYEYAVFTVAIGTLGSSATIDFKVQESSDDGAGDAYADVSGMAITQQTQAGTNASDSVVMLTVPCAGTERYLRGVLTVGTATSDAGSVGHLMGPVVVPVP